MASVLQRFLDRYKAEQPTPQCLQRIQRDLAELHADPASGVFAAPEENDMTVLHAVIVGSWDSPLEGGLFHLVLKCPRDYPMRPPHACFLTGVQKGTIGSLLVSILSLMSDGAAERMRHNTVSIAICDTLEGCLKEPPASDAMPPPLKKKVLKYFVDNYAKYEDSVKARIGSSSGIFSWLTGNSGYEPLLQRLRDIKKKIDEKMEADGQQNNE
ncbi:hypothetical protein MTO96_030113 [Rhipicephalus appendiculatus]